MDEEDLHYLGGMIDADGSIYVSVRKTDRAKYGYYIGPVVHIAGTDHPNYQVRHELFEELSKEIDADFSFEEHADTTAQSKIKGSTAIRFLEVVTPYLREKAPIAERVLEADWDGNQFGPNGRSPENWKSLVQVRTDIQELMSHSNTKRKYNEEDLMKEVSSHE